MSEKNTESLFFVNFLLNGRHARTDAPGQIRYTVVVTAKDLEEATRKVNRLGLPGSCAVEPISVISDLESLPEKIKQYCLSRNFELVARRDLAPEVAS